MKSQKNDNCDIRSPNYVASYNFHLSIVSCVRTLKNLKRKGNIHTSNGTRPVSKATHNVYNILCLVKTFQMKIE